MTLNPQPINFLPDKEWLRLIENTMLETNSGDPGILERLSPNQKFAINEIKKTFKRLQSRENPLITE